MASAATAVRVCSIDELGIGQMRKFTVAGKPVLLVRSGDGRYHALRSICSHQGVDLSRGSVTGRITSSGVGEYRYTADFEIVRCGRHGYQFDVTTGRCLLDPKARVKIYRVHVEGNDVLVEVDA